jgi:integrase
MSALRQAVDDYLTLRRSLGYLLRREERLLPKFAAYVDRSGSPFITTQLAVAWATESSRAGKWFQAIRLGMVRLFAQHVRTLDPRTEVPPQKLLPYRRVRPPPYVYSEGDIRALMGATRRLSGPLRPRTVATLIGLLAATGMRVGEAIALDRSDFNEREKSLVIRHAKFGKSRLVPLHATTHAALLSYARQRDTVFPRPRSPSFFVSQVGTRLTHPAVHVPFMQLLRWAGLSERRPRRPRIHDLRHSFAIRTLIRWYLAGVDVETRIPWLSTYLGHVSPVSTYYYLSAAPELVRLAARRLERAFGELK